MMSWCTEIKHPPLIWGVLRIGALEELDNKTGHMSDSCEKKYRISSHSDKPVVKLFG